MLKNHLENFQSFHDSRSRKSRRLLFFVMSVVEELFVSSNSTLFNVIYLYFEELMLSILDTFNTAPSSIESDNTEQVSSSASFFDYFSFDELQIKLLKGFLFILFCNIALILFTWKVYGKKISNRFMKTGNLLFQVVKFRGLKKIMQCKPIALF